MATAEDSAVADFLQILEEHRRNCERQGKYVEAEIAKNRLEELKVRVKLGGAVVGKGVIRQRLTLAYNRASLR
jgi:hypothetical protein